MKLVNLVPIKEIDINDPALMRARAAKTKMDKMKSNPRISFDQVLDLRIAKRDLEKEIANKYREMENDPNIEPEGGPVADDYGDQLNRLETRLYKINKQIALYDMSESTTLKEVTKDEWDAIDVSRKAEKELNKELGGTRKWNERTAKKLAILKDLNKAGKFKKKGGWDEETLEGWIEKNYKWEDIEKKLAEGSCGYGPDGVPGNTPGETQGMPADDRTRGMLKMLIQKEIAKLSEDNFDDRLKSMMGDDDFEKATNPKLAKLINNAIMTVDPNMSYVDFAKGVAQVLIDEYGTHNYEPFISELKKALDSTLG